MGVIFVNASVPIRTLIFSFGKTGLVYGPGAFLPSIWRQSGMGCALASARWSTFLRLPILSFSSPDWNCIDTGLDRFSPVQSCCNSSLFRLASSNLSSGPACAAFSLSLRSSRDNISKLRHKVHTGRCEGDHDSPPGIETTSPS